jgi:hypothetical protein
LFDTGKLEMWLDTSLEGMMDGAQIIQIAMLSMKPATNYSSRLAFLRAAPFVSSTVALAVNSVGCLFNGFKSPPLVNGHAAIELAADA